MQMLVVENSTERRKPKEYHKLSPIQRPSLQLRYSAEKSTLGTFGFRNPNEGAIRAVETKSAFTGISEVILGVSYPQSSRTKDVVELSAL